MTPEELRGDFVRRRKGCISLPITGLIVWSMAAVVSFFIPLKNANFALIICYLCLIPIAILIAKFRGEEMGGGAENPLFRLASMCRVMVFLLWAVLMPLLFQAPMFFPLVMGVGLGMHWIIFSWTVNHPLGVIHALLRTVLVLLAWFLFPENRVGAVSIAVALVYLVSIYQLKRMYAKFST